MIHNNARVHIELVVWWKCQSVSNDGQKWEHRKYKVKCRTYVVRQQKYRKLLLHYGAVHATVMFSIDIFSMFMSLAVNIAAAVLLPNCQYGIAHTWSGDFSMSPKTGSITVQTITFNTKNTFLLDSQNLGYGPGSQKLS